MKILFLVLYFFKSFALQKFKYKSLNFHEMNCAIDECVRLHERNVPRKAMIIPEERVINQLDELHQSKFFLVNNIENKYVRYMALYNTTHIDTSVDDWDLPLSPEIYAFIRIVPVVQVLSLEIILPNYGVDFEQNIFETKDKKEILMIARQYLIELANQSGTKFDYHGLKYFAKGKYYIEFSFC